MKSLATSLQEQFLVVLAWHDMESGIISGVVTAELFDGLNQEIASRLITFRRDYGKAPGEGIFSLFDDLAEQESWPVYKGILSRILDNRDRISPGLVVDRVASFVRRQTLKSNVVEAVRILQASDDDESLDQVEELLRQRTELAGFGDVGSGLWDLEAAWPENKEIDSVRTGIPQIDFRDLGPRRGQLHLLIAAAKVGKSFWGVHLAKQAAVLQGKSVVYITLEISKEDILRRLHRSMFGIGKRGDDAESRVIRFRRRESKIQMEKDRVAADMAEDDPAFRSNLEIKKQALDTFPYSGRFKILVKEFPGGTLTPSGLAAYLDMAEAAGYPRPDLVILDYADLMRIGADNYRIEIERLFVDLRGLAQERNFALATMSQANRTGAKASQVSTHHVAEAWGKVATADTVFTLSRTEAEAGLGLARLSVAASRVDADGVRVFISQDYSRAQFLVDSAPATQSLISEIEEFSVE